MLIPVSCFSYIPRAYHNEEFLVHFASWIGENFLFLLVPDSDRTYVVRGFYTVVVTTTQ